jgi:hypothetical protein
MQTIDTTRSSQIQRIVFDRIEGQVTGVLCVKFRKGGLYEYADVPSHIFEEIQKLHDTGGSIGSYIAKNVKGAYIAKALG